MSTALHQCCGWRLQHPRIKCFSKVLTADFCFLVPNVAASQSTATTILEPRSSMKRSPVVHSNQAARLQEQFHRQRRILHHIQQQLPVVVKLRYFHWWKAFCKAWCAVIIVEPDMHLIQGNNGEERNRRMEGWGKVDNNHHTRSPLKTVTTNHHAPHACDISRQTVCDEDGALLFVVSVGSVGSTYNRVLAQKSEQ